jgi:hypothetical protein
MDNRINNGNKGHSTKALGVDKRKNEYRTALADAARLSDVIEVIRAVMKKAKGGDIKAAQLFLEYYLGKPTNNIDITTSEGINFKDLFTFKE